MADRSRIEWTEATWNPVTGCTRISAGCAHCYAERMARRLKAMGQARYRQGFAVACHEDALEVPDHWKKPRLVFVCSMGDLFHEEVPDAFIRRVWAAMERNPEHTFQVLTKRSRRLRELAPSLAWPDHIWAGVTIETDAMAKRLVDLSHVPAAIRFLSLEPMLGPLPSLLEERALAGIGWVICGGETGPGARPMALDWVRPLRDVCVRRGIPFFFKRWGGTTKKLGRSIDGECWDQMPDRSSLGV